MANEVSLSTLTTNGGRVARLLRSEIYEMLYDRGGLRGLMRRIRRMFPGSATQAQTKVTRGAAAAAATSEIVGGASRTGLTTSTFDLVTARYLLKMAPTDAMHLTGGPIDVDYILGILAEALDLTLTDILTALFANISGNVGTSGVAASLDDIYDGIYYLNLLNNPRQLAAVFHNVQINHTIESVRGEIGPGQFRTDLQAALGMPGEGWRGRILDLDVYQCDSCPTANAGADRRGCIFSGGAFAYDLDNVADMDPMVNPNDVVLNSDELFIERSRDAENGITDFILNFYPGAAEQDDNCAVRFTTDAG